MKRMVLLAGLSIFILNSSVFGAGFGREDDFNFWTSYSGINTSSGVLDFGDERPQGHFSLTFDAREISIDQANWNFEVPQMDPSRWQAVCYLQGLYTPEGNYPKSGSFTQILDKEVVSINETLSMSSWADRLSVNGSVSVYPSVIDYSYFSFSDFMIEKWNPLTDEIVWVPGWKAKYLAEGHFVADSVEEARVLGMQFLKPVPEPSSFLMVLGFILMVLPKAVRKAFG